MVPTYVLDSRSDRDKEGNCLYTEGITGVGKGRRDITPPSKRTKRQLREVENGVKISKQKEGTKAMGKRYSDHLK